MKNDFLCRSMSANLTPSQITQPFHAYGKEKIVVCLFNFLVVGLLSVDYSEKSSKEIVYPKTIFRYMASIWNGWSFCSNPDSSDENGQKEAGFNTRK